MDYFSEKFASVYIPKKELSLDEGTMAWHGRLSFKVYNPNKPDKYGVKFYMLAEGTSGYIYKFDVYCGIGKTTVETVMGLMAPLVNKGYHLYMDNYYNSVSLTEQLREVGVYTCGTLRLQRGAPKDLQQVVKGKMATDTTLYMRKDNTFVIVWKDKRPVSVITNIHNADTTQAQRRKRVRKRDRRTGVEIVKMNKPKAIVDYNKFMKGVDHFDQMITKCQNLSQQSPVDYLELEDLLQVAEGKFEHIKQHMNLYLTELYKTSIGETELEDIVNDLAKYEDDVQASKASNL
ncbi:piggyBac transposable element-derived protein 4-like [Procambarus clarkii]|uniref:piggyBac transposable element-derived protein 4-like n=1 Tax=Procambarus clarkii TaxID=6728 RepID=UPI0037440642